jgi:hypothetical protein
MQIRQSDESDESPSGTHQETTTRWLALPSRFSNINLNFYNLPFPGSTSGSFIYLFYCLQGPPGQKLLASEISKPNGCSIIANKSCFILAFLISCRLTKFFLNHHLF